MPVENYEEVKDGSTDEEKDQLFGWLSGEGIRDSIVLDAQSDPAMVADVISRGYAPDLTEDELITLGRDPFLIAHALASPKDRCVVTTEVSKPKRVKTKSAYSRCLQFTRRSLLRYLQDDEGTWFQNRVETLDFDPQSPSWE